MLHDFLYKISLEINLENFLEFNKQKKSILSLLQNYPKSRTSIFVTSCKSNEGIIDIQKDIFALTNSR